MGERALLNRINKIKELENEVNEIQSLIDGIKDEIKADLIAKGIDETTAGDYTVRYKDVTSNRFDTTTFKKAYEELYKTYTKATTTKRFSIN